MTMTSVTSKKKVLVIILVKNVTSCLTKWVTTSTTNGLASRLPCMFAECSGACSVV